MPRFSLLAGPPLFFLCLERAKMKKRVFPPFSVLFFLSKITKTQAVNYNQLFFRQ